MKRQGNRWIFFSSLLCVTGLALLALTSAPPANAQGPIPPRIYLPLVTVGCARQIVRDPSFEAGLPNPSWATTSTVASAILDSSSIPSPTPTHSGLWKAWFGGNNTIQESLWQTVTVPASTTGLSVNFWRLITTQEPIPFTNDSLVAQIRNASGATLETLYTLWDGDASATWVNHTLSPIGNYAGQTIQIAFFAKTDATNPTSFFIDDVTVQAICGP